MDNSKTVWEEVSGGLDIMKIGNTEMPSRAYVGRFQTQRVDQGANALANCPAVSAVVCTGRKLLQVGGNVLLLSTKPIKFTLIYRNPARAGKRPPAGAPAARWLHLARPLASTYRHLAIPDYQDEGKVEFFRRQLYRIRRVQETHRYAEALEPKRIKYKRIANKCLNAGWRLRYPAYKPSAIPVRCETVGLIRRVSVASGIGSIPARPSSLSHQFHTAKAAIVVSLLLT